MPRCRASAELNASADTFFFVTTNLIRGTPPLSAADRDICVNCLGAARARFGFLLFAYVVMLDHAHLLLSTFQSDLSAIMRVWKSRSALAIQESRHDHGAIWQPRYFDFILRRASDFSKKLAYIHENPAVAKLTERPEGWRWSSAAFYTGGDHTMLRPINSTSPRIPMSRCGPCQADNRPALAASCSSPRRQGVRLFGHGLGLESTPCARRTENPQGFRM